MWENQPQKQVQERFREYMSMMNGGNGKMTKSVDPQSFKPDLGLFREKTREFYAGEMDKGAYKGFSGYYGSYAQKVGKSNRLRLRMPAGQVT